MWILPSKQGGIRSSVTTVCTALCGRTLFLHSEGIGCLCVKICSILPLFCSSTEQAEASGSALSGLVGLSLSDGPYHLGITPIPAASARADLAPWRAYSPCEDPRELRLKYHDVRNGPDGVCVGRIL